MDSLEPNSYLVLQTPREPKTIPLRDKNCWTIGRNQENDIAILDDTISRNHAILQTNDAGDFLLIDLGSSNGTFVNGRRVSIPITLQNRDKITFGQTELDFFSTTESISDDNNALENTDKQTNVLHERRLMTVMVADMRNFTGLSRQMDEKILSILIGNWFRQAGHILRQADSWVDKYIGDAVMGIWFHGQDEVQIAEILRIFRAINTLNLVTKKMTHHYPLPFPLKIGVGLNTGYAMVGNTGSGDNPDYTAIGDTVNAAFRLESATKVLGVDVALGVKTYESLAQFHHLTEYFKEYKADLKGYEEPIVTYGLTFKELAAFIQLNNTMTVKI
ncbi:MAG: FHA domain-containing protein [Microcystaceae cyanobacterium]